MVVRRMIMTGTQAEPYIRPLRFDWLTPLYDRIVPLLLPEAALKRRLIEQAYIHPGARVLDLGTGTATLAIMIKRAHQDAEVAGLDADPHALEIAAAKAAAAGVRLRLDRGFATDLPYEDGSFDRVFSSLMLHHLAGRRQAAGLCRGAPCAAAGRRIAHPRFRQAPQHSGILDLTRHAARGAGAGEHPRRLPELLREAGFVDGEETGRSMSIVGTLSLYRAVRPHDTQ